MSLLEMECVIEDNVLIGPMGLEPPTINIRAAIPGDAAAIGPLIAEALDAKYAPTLGAKAAAALIHLLNEDLLHPDHGYWVAERDGTIIGTVHIAHAEHAPPQRIARRLAVIIGWPRAIWSLAVLSTLAHGPLGADEIYVGELAVTPIARRHGVASALMHHVIAQASLAHKSRITLWVTDDNSAALALYARMGFTRVGHRTLRLSRRVFGSRGAQLLEYRVPAAEDS